MEDRQIVSCTLRDGKVQTQSADPESSWWRKCKSGFLGLMPIEGEL
jgi:hypothetical protein